MEQLQGTVRLFLFAAFYVILDLSPTTFFQEVS